MTPEQVAEIRAQAEAMLGSSVLLETEGPAFLERQVPALIARVIAAEAERDALVVANAEMRAVLSDAIDAHTREDVLARAYALLATDSDERGAALLSAAKQMADALEWVRGTHQPPSARVRNALDAYRALVPRAAGEG